jgi:hypothetical protein
MTPVGDIPPIFFLGSVLLIVNMGAVNGIVQQRKLRKSEE